MKISVNDLQIELHNGAKVKDAIRKYYSQLGLKEPDQFPLVKDNYGNIIAVDGEMSNDNKLFIKKERKKSVSLFRLFVVVLGFSVLSAGSICWQTATTGQTDRHVTILAVNDMHATIDNFPKFAAIVDSLRAIYPDMLLFSAGDNQTGNPVNDQYPQKGLPMIELMNAVEFDLSAVGNHEFDSHPDGFRNLIQKAKFDFICANVKVPDSIEFKVNPYKIITMPNGLKIAVLGLLHISSNGIPDTHPDNVKGITFRSPFETAPGYMYLKDQCDIFIILSHIGFESDVKLAETLPPGVDLIIGGHSHTRVEKEQIHNGVMITQAENKLKYATLIKLSVSDDGTLHREMELISIRDSNKEKPSVRAMVDKFNDNPALNKVIASATDDFSSYEELGYFMADALRSSAGTDIALVNPGGVRSDHLSKGNISVMDVYRLDPFGNEIVLFNLTGKEIRSLLLAAFTVDDKLPIYPAGMKTNLKLDSNGNLVDVTLYTDKGNLFDLEKTYTVAMNSFMAVVYKYDHKDPGQSIFRTTAEGTIEYLKALQKVRSYRGEKRVNIN
jgi:5'-nucleotidase / UDP-sugar diphosphatase